MRIDTITTASTVLSVLVAIGALIVAFLVERRNQARFEEQLHQSRELAQASIKPLLSVTSQIYEDLKSVRIVNRGIGPAVITKMVFSRGDTKSTDLVDLFHLDGRIRWDFILRPPDDRFIVRKDETVDLVRLSEEGLLNNQPDRKSAQEARSILAQWQQQKRGIHVLLEYEDVLGNKQPAYEDVLN